MDLIRLSGSRWALRSLEPTGTVRLLWIPPGAEIHQWSASWARAAALALFEECRDLGKWIAEDSE